MNENKTESKPKKGGTKSQVAIYQKVASREDEILEVLFAKLHSKNDSVAIAAARTLIDKILPDLKAMELTGENNGPMVIRIITDNGNRTSNQELPETAGDL